MREAVVSLPGVGGRREEGWGVRGGERGRGVP